MPRAYSKAGVLLNKMKNKTCSKKIYFIIAIIVAALSIAYMIIPNSECVNQRFGPLDVFHWDVCSNMTFMQNLLYVVSGVILALGSAYLIIAGIIYLRFEQ